MKCTSLYRDINICNGITVAEKVDELLERLPKISLVAVGGFPFEKTEGGYSWLGEEANIDVIRHHVAKALGFSGMLTYMNPSSLTMEEMSEVCKSRGHLWAYNWITVSLLFVGVPQAVELAFLRNGNFFESWPVKDNRIFVMNSSLKTLIKFVSNRDDKSFDEETRKVMHEIHNEFSTIWT